MDLTDIFRTFHHKETEYTFFSSAHGTFSRIDHILGHKSSLNWYQKIGIIPCIFSDHNALKLEFNQKRKVGKNSNTRRPKSILLCEDKHNRRQSGFSVLKTLYENICFPYTFGRLFWRVDHLRILKLLSNHLNYANYASCLSSDFIFEKKSLNYNSFLKLWSR